jgi:hypothetical protein
MQKVVIVSFTDTKSDPRVLRQIQALMKISDLTVYGFGPPPGYPVKFVPFASEEPWPEYSLWAKMIDFLLLAFRLNSSYYWRRTEVKFARHKGLRKDCDTYIANDFDSLPFVLKMAPRGAKVYLDAHEYTPDQSPRDKWYSGLIRKYLADWLVGKHIQLVDGMMTVAPGIADVYAAKYGVTEPVVVMNTPNFESLNVQPTRANVIRLVHHGIASPRRGVHLLIDLMDELDSRFELNLILVDGGSHYLEELRIRAQRSRRADDIHFHEPVATSKIASHINQFDLGIIWYPPVTLNERLSLPNKFFEFIQGRVGIVVGPSPEMSRIVSDSELGIVSETFDLSRLSCVINNISSSDIDRFKHNSDSAARKFSWEQNEERMLMTLNLC